MPHEYNTRSRVAGPSPAMLPRAHTACSTMSIRGEDNKASSLGMAPSCTTACVCSVVPDDTFVSAQHASNCSSGLLQHNN